MPATKRALQKRKDEETTKLPSTITTLSPPTKRAKKKLAAVNPSLPTESRSAITTERPITRSQVREKGLTLSKADEKHGISANTALSTVSRETQYSTSGEFHQVGSTEVVIPQNQMKLQIYGNGEKKATILYAHFISIM